MADQLRSISTAGLDAESAEAIKNLIKVAKREESLNWEWSEAAPLGHVRLYSANDAITQFEIFKLVVESPDSDHKAFEEDDWENGKFSTVRSRLQTIKDREWIKAVQQ